MFGKQVIQIGVKVGPVIGGQNTELRLGQMTSGTQRHRGNFGKSDRLAAKRTACGLRGD